MYCEETFAPVVAIQPFDRDEEAVEIANATHYGLTASALGRDTGRAGRMAHRLQAGVVNVNGPSMYAEPNPADRRREGQWVGLL